MQDEIEAAERAFRQNAKPFVNGSTTHTLTSPGSFAPAEIEVYWNVVVANDTYEGGWIPREQIAKQMLVLNQDFALAGLTFTGILVTRIIHPVWFSDIGYSSELQDEMKRKYRKGGPRTLNIYTVGFLQDSLLGYATFPHQYESEPLNDGVVLKYSTTPGGAAAPYNLGRTLTHEVGHWLGLYHTFQGGCDGPGDRVDDTPPQGESTAGCPVGQNKDTCPGGGPDPIHNFMDWSDDTCLTELTPGQVQRLREQIAYYRGIDA
ncbi:hypothetical protein AX16_007995 [Volvariella volvacea WC 439]|nr:hypothetical protein AX16_007995 [Volvariella volvacea WC 439]